MDVRMAKSPRLLSAHALKAREKIRATLKDLDDIEETTTYGNPTFKVGGRAFGVLDSYEGRDCLWMLVDAIERDQLLSERGWFPSPYDPRKTALCCYLDAIDWRRAKPLLRSSYEIARSSKSKRRPRK